MAKTVKQRQDPAANPRSRAAKRATSPSINVDKSIKDAPRAHGASPMLGVTHASGISKKKKSKQMTRGQRMRQEKGLARAEAVMNQMEKKVGGAKERLKTRQGRKSAWEDINNTAADELRKMPKPVPQPATTENDQESMNRSDEGDVQMASTTHNTTDTTTTRNEIESHLQSSNDAVLPSANTEAARDEFDLIT